MKLIIPMLTFLIFTSCTVSNVDADQVLLPNLLDVNVLPGSELFHECETWEYASETAKAVQCIYVPIKDDGLGFEGWTDAYSVLLAEKGWVKFVEAPGELEVFFEKPIDNNCSETLTITWVDHGDLEYYENGEETGDIINTHYNFVFIIDGVLVCGDRRLIR